MNVTLSHHSRPHRARGTLHRWGSSRMHFPLSLLGLAVVWSLCGGTGQPLHAQDDYERAPVNYATAPANNPISRLQQQIDNGTVKLEYIEHFGYLKSVLDHLKIPLSSQLLVFSKTSLQRHFITPEGPRSLYFDDESYIGFCQNGEVVEVSTTDPVLGTVFYTLDQERKDKPKFLRQGDSCTICHSSSHTLNVPGHLIRSVFVDPRGEPILASGSFRIDQTSPLSQRWGGWYVTGTHGTQKHLGNLIVRGKQNPEEVNLTANANLKELGNRIHPENHLTPHSDLVAHLVLEHQAQAHNHITRANFETRMALHYEQALNRDLGEPKNHRWNSTDSRIRSVGEPLVKYLLFCDEPQLSHPVTGTSSYQQEFQALGPRDSQGRSLRDFDLQRRLFRYPCSYLIYSASFDALPNEVRKYVYQRLWDVLNGKEQDKTFAHLSVADRRAILEILLATKANLPDYWKGAAVSQISR